MRFFASDMSARSDRVVARTGLLLLAIILCAGGLLAIWQLALGPLVDVWRSRDWQVVSARVEEARLLSGMEGKRLEVRYRYYFSGRIYRSERYGLYRWLADSSALDDVYANLLYSRSVKAWVNPEDPEEALLNRDISWPVALLAIPACGMVLLGSALLWAAFVAWRDLLRNRKFCGRR